jgi:hypothetical protein
MVNKTGLLIGFLVLVIVVLLGIVLFAFWVKPTIDGYVVEKQVDAQNIILNNIVEQAARCQQVSLPFRNQTINLIAVECLQQPPQQVQAPLE